MSDDYSTFDCPAFVTAFANARNISPSSLVVCITARGSSIVEIDADVAVSTAVLDELARKVDTGIPRLVSVTDPQTGAVTPADQGGLSLGLIVGIALGALVGLILIAVVVILCLKHRRNSRSMKGASSAVSYVPLTASATTRPASTSSNPPLLRARLLYNVVDDGEGILKLPSGSQVTYTREDFSSASAWCWVTSSNGQSGYVPTAYLQKE